MAQFKFYDDDGKELLDTTDKFRALHQVIGMLDGAGTVFVPADLESEWEQWVESDPDLPSWEDAEDELLSMWEWRKGLEDLLTERGFEIIQQGIGDMVAAARKRAEETGEPITLRARF